MVTRRAFIRTLAAGSLFLPALATGCGALRTPARRAGSAGWGRVPDILARIRPPVFPDRDFPLTAFGAQEGGTAENTEAIHRAVEACRAAGGGRVVVPPGVFLTGPVHLRSNVELHVSEGATLRFVRDPNAYLPAVFTRWEGVELMGYSPFIYAFGQDNIALTGRGTLDGNADCVHWWPWKGRTECGWKPGAPHQQDARTRLFAMAEAGTPPEERVFADGSYLRPQFIQPYRCRNVLIEGVTILNSPMWEINPVLCENVTVRGVRIESHGPNNDGCDPESCRDVLIEDSSFDTGDDCIAIKSGRNADGRRLGVPSENIIVRGCRMKDGHGGVTIGSEISGGVRNVFAENCRMDSPHLERALRIKTNAVRGGTIEHVYMRNVEIGQVEEAVVSINFYYEEGDAGSFLPTVRNIYVENVTSEKSTYALFLKGFPNAPITDVHIEDCVFRNVEKGNVLENVERIELEEVEVVKASG